MKFFWKIMAIIALSIGVCYTGFTYYYQTHFVPGTKFGSIRISGMTKEKAEEVVKQHFDNQTIQIKVHDEVVKELPRKDFIDDDVLNSLLTKQLKKQNAFAWPLDFFKNNTITFEEAFKQNQSDKTIKPLTDWLNQYNNNKTNATNASIKYENGSFVIKQAKDGTKINTDQALEKIVQAITNNKNEVNLDNCFVKPTITADNEHLQTALAKFNKIATIKVQYEINDKTITIPNDKIDQWLTTDDQGNPTLDKDQVKQYVQNLADEYNTAGKNIKFASTKQGEVTLPCETYSYSISVNDETTKLMDQILKGEDFTRTPVVKGSAKASGPFIGKTYIEVDKSNQHMWYYKDGKEVISTDIVTGKPESPTPTGVFYVWNKERNAVLRGPGYESPVSYWMPIDWSGVGIHDSNWQTAYGGTRYKDGFGSHGCVNTPPSVMANLFEQVAVGTPVIVLP